MSFNSILTYKKDEGEDFYRILGCDEKSTCEQILAEYRIRVLDCHPDKHPEDETANERFTHLLHAKEVLLNEREHYDRWRNSGIAMTYKQWAAHKDTIGTSLHWAYKKTEPMLTGTQDHQKVVHQCQSGTREQKWSRNDVSDALRKFRNYQV